MNKHKIPDYYLDKGLTEEQKTALDMEMIAKDFPIAAEHSHLSDGKVYLSYPVQYKCATCGEFYR